MTRWLLRPERLLDIMVLALAVPTIVTAAALGRSDRDVVRPVAVAASHAQPARDATRANRRHGLLHASQGETRSVRQYEVALDGCAALAAASTCTR